MFMIGINMRLGMLIAIIYFTNCEIFKTGNTHKFMSTVCWTSKAWLNENEIHKSFPDRDNM